MVNEILVNERYWNRSEVKSRMDLTVKWFKTSILEVETCGGTSPFLRTFELVVAFQLNRFIRK